MVSYTQVVDKLQSASQPEEVKELLSSFAALNADEQSTQRTDYALKIFSRAFPESAAAEQSEKFAENGTSVWSVNCALSPKIYLTPKNNQDVAAALVICQFLDVPFSVRGGGHTQNPGWTSNNDGVVISMSGLRQLEVTEGKKTVNVGPGLTWSDVYNGLEPEGITVTGGRISTVGVPGLILGGGLSFLNSEYGLSCMGVVRYEVVLADGTVVNATSDENTDLFWALKGGGTNYGIVTNFEMTAIKNDAWCEVRVVAQADSHKYMEALIPYSDAIEKDTHASVIYNETAQVTVLVMFYTAAVDDKPEIFKPFYELPYISHLVPPAKRTIAQIVQAVKDVNDSTIRRCHDFITASSLPDLEAYKAAAEARLRTVDELKGSSVEAVIVIQPLSSLMVKACERSGGTPLGLDPRGQEWFLVEMDYEQQDEDQARAAGKAILEAFETKAKENGTLLPFRFLNYSSRDQDPLSSYGPDNLQKLREIAAKYDPDEVFQRLQYGGWLLSRAGKMQ